jgi:hypothetical protein
MADYVLGASNDQQTAGALGGYFSAFVLSGLYFILYLVVLILTIKATKAKLDFSALAILLFYLLHYR